MPLAMIQGGAISMIHAGSSGLAGDRDQKRQGSGVADQ